MNRVFIIKRSFVDDRGKKRDIFPYLHANNHKWCLKFDRPKQGDQFSMGTQTFSNYNFSPYPANTAVNDTPWRAQCAILRGGCTKCFFLRRSKH